MDPFSVTAGIVGILGVVAQSIKGIETLRRFVKNVRAAPDTVKIFLQDIEVFQKSLSQTQSLLLQLANSPALRVEPRDLNVLQSQVASCVADIEEWLALAAKLDLAAAPHGIDAFFKKIRVARNKHGASEFHRRIATHQQALGISLSVLENCLTLRSYNLFETVTTEVLKRLQTITSRLPTQGVSEALVEYSNQIKSWADTDMKNPMMQKIDAINDTALTTTRHSVQMSQDVRSLSDAVSSISSEVSFIKETLSNLAHDAVKANSAKNTSSVLSGYSCGAVLGIDQAFVEDRCSYCGDDFDGIDSRFRGFHLVSEHKFGGCDASIIYDGWNQKLEFRKHLRDFHGQKANVHFQRFTFRGKSLIQDRLWIDIKAETQLEDQSDISCESCTGSLKNAEADSLSDLLMNLDAINDYIRGSNIDDGSDQIKTLDDGTVAPNSTTELDHQNLLIFRNIYWKLQSVLERANITDANEKQHYKDLASDLPEYITISTILWRLRLHEELSVKLHFFDLYLQKVDNRSMDPLYWDYSAQIHSLEKCNAFCSSTEQEMTALPLFAGKTVRVLRRERESDWIWIEDQATSKSGKIPRKCVRRFLDTSCELPNLETKLPASRLSALMPGGTNTSTPAFQLRVWSWLHQFMHNSNTIRVLASYNLGIMATNVFQTHVWIEQYLKDLEMSAYSCNIPDHLMPRLSSDGAVDSRDDLISERFKLSLELRTIFEELNMAQYLDKFIEEGVDTWDKVCQLNETDYTTMGIKLGHRLVFQTKVLADSKKMAGRERGLDNREAHRGSHSRASLSTMSSIDSILDGELVDEESNLFDTYGDKFRLPNYTMNEIRNAVPKHCYERSAVRGLSYVFRDIAFIVATFCIFDKCVKARYIPSNVVRGILWAVYTFIQGLFAMGLWVLAHECGHQSFSRSKILNDTVGFICHSALLVPYFSWKISHHKHHQGNGNIVRDTVNVPLTRDAYYSGRRKVCFRGGVEPGTNSISIRAAFGTPNETSRKHENSNEIAAYELCEEMPIVTVLRLLGQQISGWPLYLLVNKTGRTYRRWNGKKSGFFDGVNHFNPSSPLYENKDTAFILLSDFGLIITVIVLYTLVSSYGIINMLIWYFVPYLWLNHWIVITTYLQHTDPSLPHYNPEHWNFVRGAAATIDRDFGFIGRHIFHCFTETHVLHHYISMIPFYHAEEATEAIKQVMKNHYRSDVERGPLAPLKNLWKIARWCQWVEPPIGAASGILFFRNSNGLGLPPADFFRSRKSS